MSEKLAQEERERRQDEERMEKLRGLSGTAGDAPMSGRGLAMKLSSLGSAVKDDSSHSGAPSGAPSGGKRKMSKKPTHTESLLKSMKGGNTRKKKQRGGTKGSLDDILSRNDDHVRERQVSRRALASGASDLWRTTSSSSFSYPFSSTVSSHLATPLSSRPSRNRLGRS